MGSVVNQRAALRRSQALAVNAEVHFLVAALDVPNPS